LHHNGDGIRAEPSGRKRLSDLQPADAGLDMTDTKLEPLALSDEADAASPGAATESTAVVRPRLASAGGVVIDGLNLSWPIPAAATLRVLAAFRDHHVVIFRHQSLSREQQYAFAATIGEVEHSPARKSQNKRHAVAHIISNVGQDGRPVDRSASAVSNYNWHTDKPYYRAPPMMTALYAVEMPPRGGDTEFANTALAYDALPSQEKRRLAGLRVVFYWGASAAPGPSGAPAGAGSGRSEVADHPLVRTHPETGAKALYLGNHSSHILGWPLATGRALLDELLAHATRPEFVYTHRWQVGDLVMWDNRCLLHRAVANFALDRHRRVLHRTVVRGTEPF
jgi:alpha-ketoglutarate-dependent taurine dioxygenase